LVKPLAAFGQNRFEIGRAGRARVLARHDIDTEAGRLAALFADHPPPERPIG